MTRLDSGNNLCGYSREFSGEVVSNNSGIIENVDVRCFGRYVFGILGNQANVLFSWWRSIVVRPPVLAGELSLSCAKLMAGRVTTLWVKRPLSVNQHGQLSLPSLRGRLNE